VTRKPAAILVAASTAALLIAGLTLTSSAAPDRKSHTVHYDAKTVSVVKLDKLDRVSTSDLSSRHIATAGQIRGAAVFTCHQKTAHASAVHCKSAIALKGGILYGHSTLAFATYRLTGRITGGSGIFKGATGKFFAVADSHSTKRSILTVTYKT